MGLNIACSVKDKPNAPKLKNVGAFTNKVISTRGLHHMPSHSPEASTPAIRARALNMRQLEVFHAIMTTGTISGAALALHVSQPALSRALAHCEARLGYLLFERQGRRLQPTPEAQRLHEEARDLYRGLDRLNTLAQRIGQAGVDTLHLACSATFANTLIPQALQQLMRYSPQLRVDFRTATYDELPEYLLSGQADVGVSLVESNHPGLKSRLIGRQHLVCVLPPQHPLADRALVDPVELCETAWIGYPPDTPLGRLCASALTMDVSSASIQVRSPAIALSCVQTGLGAAIVDASCIPPIPRDDIVVRPLTADVYSDIWAITSARQPCAAAGQQFIDALHAVLRQLSASAP
ncbi:LysR family transcriptional regulator [Comamonas sediminis]|uniref:LysR family transcriptional regulator n=2 Tax=Comamonas TaxID=283 RepID=A0ABV4AXX1_9BURK